MVRVKHEGNRRGTTSTESEEVVEELDNEDDNESSQAPSSQCGETDHGSALRPKKMKLYEAVVNSYLEDFGTAFDSMSISRCTAIVMFQALALSVKDNFISPKCVLELLLKVFLQKKRKETKSFFTTCLLYTSDAADD